VLALGGVGAANAAACRRAGAAGIAVMGGVMRATDPERALAAMIAALDSGSR
jgi:thiamine-phosphate pyrophosphorylase